MSRGLLDNSKLLDPIFCICILVLVVDSLKFIDVIGLHSKDLFLSWFSAGFKYRDRNGIANYCTYIHIS